jgi:hypothetical protein
MPDILFGPWIAIAEAGRGNVRHDSMRQIFLMLKYNRCGRVWHEDTQAQGTHGLSHGMKWMNELICLPL